MRNLLCNSMPWELFEHDVNVDQAVASTIHENDGRLDIASGKLGNLVITIRGGDTEWGLYVVVVHLKAVVADDLKPVNHTLGTRVRI